MIMIPYRDPATNDVIFGRGHSILNRPGNKRYHRLIRAQKPKYDAAPKHRKEDVVYEIIDTIRSLDPPGRFLLHQKQEDASSSKARPSGNYYTTLQEANERRTVLKVRQALRDVKVKGRIDKQNKATFHLLPSHPEEAPLGRLTAMNSSNHGAVTPLLSSDDKHQSPASYVGTNLPFFEEEYTAEPTPGNESSFDSSSSSPSPSTASAEQVERRISNGNELPILGPLVKQDEDCDRRSICTSTACPIKEVLLSKQVNRLLNSTSGITLPFSSNLNREDSLLEGNILCCGTFDVPGESAFIPESTMLSETWLRSSAYVNEHPYLPAKEGIEEGSMTTLRQYEYSDRQYEEEQDADANNKNWSETKQHRRSGNSNDETSKDFTENDGLEIDTPIVLHHDNTYTAQSHSYFTPSMDVLPNVPALPNINRVSSSTNWWEKSHSIPQQEESYPYSSMIDNVCNIRGNIQNLDKQPGSHNAQVDYVCNSITVKKAPESQIHSWSSRSEDDASGKSSKIGQHYAGSTQPESVSSGKKRYFDRRDNSKERDLREIAISPLTSRSDSRTTVYAGILNTGTTDSLKNDFNEKEGTDQLDECNSLSSNDLDQLLQYDDIMSIK